MELHTAWISPSFSCLNILIRHPHLFFPQVDSPRLSQSSQNREPVTWSLSGNTWKGTEYKSPKVYFYSWRSCFRPYKVNHSVSREANVLVCSRFRPSENNPLHCAQLRAFIQPDWDLSDFYPRWWGLSPLPISLQTFRLYYVKQWYQFHKILTIYYPWMRNSREIWICVILFLTSAKVMNYNQNASKWERRLIPNKKGMMHK